MRDPPILTDGDHIAYEMASKAAAQGIAMLPANYWQSQHKLSFQLFLGNCILSPLWPYGMAAITVWLLTPVLYREGTVRVLVQE
jgi:hypothetical protein